MSPSGNLAACVLRRHMTNQENGHSQTYGCSCALPQSPAERSCPKTSRSQRRQLGLAESVAEKRSSLGAAAAPTYSTPLCHKLLPPSVACSFELAVVRRHL